MRGKLPRAIIAAMKRLSCPSHPSRALAGPRFPAGSPARFPFAHRLLAAVLASSLLLTGPGGVPLAGAAAVGLPDLGDESQVDVSPVLERKAGESVFNDIRVNDPAYLDDPEVKSYLDTLGNRLAAATGVPGISFVFFPMRDPQINAFATYGGYVGVNSGLIVEAQTESELAGVLSHEISHVTQRHLARGISQQKRSSLPMMIAMAVALLAARSNAQVSQAAIVGSQAAAMQSQLSFTREMEREADRVGFDVLRRAGFDVNGMADFFKRLERATRLYENNAPSYLRTHPLSGERMSDMQNRAAEVRFKQIPDSPEFLLVRAKLRAEQGPAHDAVIHFANVLQERKFAAEYPARYGYARALLRDRQFDAAERELKPIRRIRLGLPTQATSAALAMIEHLAAEIATARGDFSAAESIYRDAIKIYAGSQALRYGLLDTLIQAKRLPLAEAAVNAALKETPSDEQLYSFQARIAAAQGQIFLQHRAQAEVYARQGRLQAAIEQLQFAQQAKDGNFYDMSAVDARLRELKRRLADEMRERNRE